MSNFKEKRNNWEHESKYSIKKKKKKKTHRKQIINISIEKKNKGAGVLALYKTYWAAMNKFFIYERP